jgi:predicted hydrocarbon binding protein
MDDSHALLEKSTPHVCYLEEGIVAEALATVGCGAMVTQTRCLREGHDLCVFEVRPVAGPETW